MSKHSSAMTHYVMTYAEHCAARDGYVDPDLYREGHLDYRPAMLCRTGDGHANGTRDRNQVNCPRCIESMRAAHGDLT